MRVRGLHLTGGIIIVLAVALIGASLALQGWKSRIPASDVLLSIDGAHELVAHVRIPDRDALSSFGSYNPPGPAWLMTPGVLLFNDPRLVEFVGSMTVYVGTLIGLFLLSHSYFGLACATLSVLLYGLSQLGLYVAGSLWDRLPLHFFYVWMIYWTVQWVRQKDAKHLAGAVATWAVGMYVFMEIAPAVFILPVIWAIYRPPIKLQAVAVAGLLALTIWYPYLRLQYKRNFVDVRSLVSRQSILPHAYKTSWCDPALVLLNWGNMSAKRNVEAPRTVKTADSRGMQRSSFIRLFVERGMLIVAGLLSNFEHSAPFPGNSLFLLLLVLVSLLGLSVSRSFFGTKVFGCLCGGVWLTQCAITAICAGLLANEFLLARYLSFDGVLEPSTTSSIRWLQSTLVICGVALLILKKHIVAAVKRLPNLMIATDRKRWPSGDARLLVASLVIPWLTLLLILENSNRPERLWWVWPLQVLFLAASVAYLPLRFRAPRLVSWIGSFVLLALLAVNPLLLARLQSWFREGWSGRDAEEILVVDYIASRLMSEGKDHVSVGYDIYTGPFNAVFNVADRHYKVGAPLDRVFKDRYGITNTDVCAEGVSPDDEYRIVQTGDNPNPDYSRIEVALDPSFRLVQEFASYSVYRRH